MRSMRGFSRKSMGDQRCQLPSASLNSSRSDWYNSQLDACLQYAVSLWTFEQRIMSIKRAMESKTSCIVTAALVTERVPEVG
jgi:hypothetical protein